MVGRREFGRFPDCGAPRDSSATLGRQALAVAPQRAGGVLSWPRGPLSQLSVEVEAFARGEASPSPGVQAARLGAPAAQDQPVGRAAAFSPATCCFTRLHVADRAPTSSHSEGAHPGAACRGSCAHVAPIRSNGAPVPVLVSRRACGVGRLGARVPSRVACGPQPALAREREHVRVHRRDPPYG